MFTIQNFSPIDFMHEVLNDPIDVIVSFAGSRVIPKRFRWNEKDYDIKNVNLVHTAREGTKRIFYFSVSDLTNYFKLRLDPEFLEWRLVELYTDG
jgi:hypothetical protein